MRHVDRRIRTLRLLVALVAALVIICSPGRARATDVPAQGGAGGGAFRLPCPPNSFMLGVGLRSGAWVDAIRANCVGFDASAHQFAGSPQFTAFAGGNGGSLQQNGCPQDRYVSAIKIGFTRDENRPKYLDYVELTCTVLSGYGGDTRVCLHTGDQCWDRHPSPGPYNGWGLSFRAACPAGEAALGMIGRSGAYVDALGLICGPKPTAVASSNSTSSYMAMMLRCKHAGGTWDYVTRRCRGTTDAGAPPPDWADMLAAHNERRSRHCVPPLTWSSELAKAAQAYADTCNLGQHGSDGENMADFVRWDGNNQPVLPAKTDRQAFEDTWYCEFKNYNFDNPTFEGGFTQNCVRVNGHFTQVVWKTTRQLGCGRKTCTINGRQGTHWVCRYSPVGNQRVVPQPPAVSAEEARANLIANVQRPCK